MSTKTRNIAGFGKRVEYWIIGLMLKEGIDIYVPLSDYDGTDLVIKKSSGTFIEVQIKASANTIAAGYSGLFGKIHHKNQKRTHAF